MAGGREIAFDVLKGIGIAEVLTHHTLSWSARKFSEPQSAEWWGLMLANRALHFAIPTFLLVSAILLARSLAKQNPDLARYGKRRVLRSLVPYLVWSLIYLFFRAFVVRVGSDVAPYTLALPWGGSVTGPNVLLDPAELRYYALWGKAYFHLYFLSVLLQLSLILPLLVWGLKRVRISFGGMAALAIALQVGVYLLQANVWRSPHPASLALWYLPAILLGCWLGVYWGRWKELRARWSRLWAIAAAAGAAPYLVLSANNLADGPVSTLLLNVCFSFYATSLALWLLHWASGARLEARWAPTLAKIGALSLPLFVLHPIVLHLLGGPRITRVLDAIPFSPGAALVILFGVTYALARLTILLRLDGLLFGRRFVEEPPAGLPSPASAPAATR
jgi:peptidoglycan/LPS O-acetylase OafA/YrhL